MKKIALFFILLIPGLIFAEKFKLKQIDVEGLRRIDKGLVYNNIPLGSDEYFNTKNNGLLIKDLYKTGYFSDVSLYKKNNKLIIKVIERSIISDIKIKGNEGIKTEDLRKVLASINIKEGFAYNPYLLKQIQWDLKRQYYMQGKYSARVDIDVKKSGDGMVDILLDISEGKTAVIKQITFVGNKFFSDKELLNQLSSSPDAILNILLSNDFYQQQKVAGDIEELKSFYLDRGFADFKIKSIQTEISPDKKFIFITLNISEGERYKINKIDIEGETIVPREELYKLINIRSGDVYSMRKINLVKSSMKHKLTRKGYSYTEIDVITDFNKVNNTLSLLFYIKPGNKIYVRNINFNGNIHTNDEVLRREILQLEGSIVSTDKIDESKNRLNRLGYIKNAEAKITPVPGMPNMVDVDFSVVEGASGKFSGGIEYNQLTGFGGTVSLSHDNILGTGKSGAIDFKKNAAILSSSIYYNNPYISTNGAGLGFSAFYSKTNAEKMDLSNYSTDRFGGHIFYNVPISLHDRLTYGFEYQNLSILTPDTSKPYREDLPSTITDFLNKYGKKYNLFYVDFSWHHSSLNRAIFPTNGTDFSLGNKTALPGSNLRYYIFDTNFRYYHPLIKDFVLFLHGGASYGNHYDGTNDYPFFENFYSGGMSTVRGFSDYSLGPTEEVNVYSKKKVGPIYVNTVTQKTKPVGGNLSLHASLELIFPTPFITTDTVRTSAFFDAGNVFNNDLKLDEIRASVGVSLLWLTPLNVPINFSFAWPVMKKSGDKTESVQFAMGVTY